MPFAKRRNLVAILMRNDRHLQESDAHSSERLLALGEYLARAYRDALPQVPIERCDGALLAQTAANVLRERVSSDDLQAANLLEAASQSSMALGSFQEPSRFSDLQFVLFRSEDVIVELLFWLTGTTSIHDHAFAGAFTVVEGRSLQVKYLFHADTEETRNFRTGRLRAQSASVLQRGAVCPIDPGSAGLHSVFHLESPSVTLLLRTPVQQRWWPQYEYRGGVLAVNAGELANSLIKRIQALRLISMVEPRRFVPALQASLAVATSEEAYWLRRSLDGEIERLPDGAPVLELLRSMPDGAVIEQAISREKAVARLVGLRRHGGSPEYRELLALLMNLGDLAMWREVMRSGGLRLSGVEPTVLQQMLAEILDKAGAHQSPAPADLEEAAHLLHPFLASPHAISDVEIADRTTQLNRNPLSRLLFPLLGDPLLTDSEVLHEAAGLFERH